jgi:acyl-CoA synthetase (AMP-forming)/AMP-acid ligase II
MTEGIEIQRVPGLDPSAYVDNFARRGLPPAELWPVIDDAALARLGYPKRINAAVELLDQAVARGLGSRPRAVEFVDELPKTQTGKINRMVLRWRGKTLTLKPKG